MSELFWVVFVPVAVAGVSGALLAWAKPAWSLRRTALVAAFPLPLAGALLCAFVFIRAAMSPAKKCGVDACGMAILFSTILLGCAFLAFALGLIAALLAKYLVDRR